MQTVLTKDHRLMNLEEELASVKEEITGFRMEVNERFDQMKSDMDDDSHDLGKKLDKILEVVSGKESKVDERLEHLEHHRTHPPIVQ